MKISIDTKEDSPEEIRKLIRMLSALVGDSVPENSPPEADGGIFDMFGDPAQSSSPEQQPGSGGNSGATDINDFLDKPDSSKSHESSDDIRIVPY